MEKLAKVMTDRSLCIEAKAVYAYFFFLKDELDALSESKITADLNLTKELYNVYLVNLSDLGYIELKSVLV